MRTALALGFLASCGEEPTLRQAITFDRPDGIAFACLHVEDDATLGMPEDACDPDLEDCAEGQDPAEGGCRDPLARLHALVLQSTRGEMSVVDLREDEILDVDPVVPGFSSHGVGALPVAVAVSGNGAEVFVASLGERSVLVLSSASLREIGVGPTRTFALTADPADMIFADGRLVVAMPEAGVVSVVDPATGEELFFVALGAPVGGGGDDAGPDDAGLADAGADAGEPDAGQEELDFAHPVDLALAADGSVWVADIGTHRAWHVGLEGEGEILGSIDVGVTTSRIAISPDGLWLYAVDAEFGQVVVVDLDSGDVVDPNLAPYDPLAEGSGIPVPGLARDVTFVERTDPLEEDDVAGPFRLSGLFAFVASSNGFVYVVDVRDDDAAAGARPNTDEGETDLRYEVAEHHLRSAEYLTDDDGARLAAAPDLTRPIGARDTGCELVCFQPHFDGVCGDGHCDDPDPAGADTAAFGIRMAWEDEDRAHDTLWRTTNENWDVVHEGPLPSATRSRGRIEEDAGDYLEDDRASFCRYGVEQGDRIVILEAPIPVETATAECPDVPYDCAAFELDEDGTGVEATITEVSRYRLDVDDWPGHAQCCHSQFTRYQVRVPSGQWVVVGSETGYLHPWTTDEDDRCIEDPELTDVQRELFSGRARTDEVFRNPYFSFTLVPGLDAAEGDPQRDDAYAFTTAGAFSPIALSAGALVTDVVRPPVGESLFVVDSSRGVLEFSLEDLGFEEEFR